MLGEIGTKRTIRVIVNVKWTDFHLQISKRKKI